MMVVALAKPRQAIAPMFTTITATAFAATISSPICPRIAANAELAKLQTTSFITAGEAIFIKSRNRIPDFAKKYFIRNLTSELFNE